MTRLKILLALLGFAMAAIGMALDLRLLVWAALIVLAAALAIRLWQRRRLPPRDGEPRPQQ